MKKNSIVLSMKNLQLSILLLSVVLFSCEEGKKDETTATVTTDTAASGVPTFHGPWAAELKQSYTNAKSSLARKIFADSKITGAEVAEANGKVSEVTRKVTLRRKSGRR